jgi:hypothetical protein
MKKLLFLFVCMAAVAGFAVADDYRPPGAPALELSGYGVGCEAVAPDTVLAVAPLIVAEPVSMQVVMAIDEGSVQPQIVLGLTVDNMALPEAPSVDYPLRI